MPRLFMSTVAVLWALFASAMPVLAEYPARPITLIVPAAAGGFNDVIVRIVADHMAKTLGQPIIIENDGGAGGTTAIRRAAQAATDGYTIVVESMGTHAAAPAQYPNLKYDPAKDFTPIGLMAEAPAVIVTRKDFPAKDLKEFVDYVRENQAKVNENAIIGTKTARVAYRGAAPAINLVAGQVDFSCISLSSVVSPSLLPAPNAPT